MHQEINQYQNLTDKIQACNVNGLKIMLMSGFKAL